MKKIVMVFLMMAWSNSICWAIEAAPRITDREIIERLTRVEEGQKAILREMGIRFKSIEETQRSMIHEMERRFKSLEETQRSMAYEIDRRFDQLINIITAIIMAFAGIVAVTIGFAIWDRRTMIRPFETRVKAMESQIDEARIKVQDFDEDKLVRLIGAMRKLAESNRDIADALRSFNLL